MNKRKRHLKKKLKAIEAHNNKMWDDCFDLDHTLAIYILPRLKWLKKHSNGYPGCFDTPEEWDDVLDQMIYAFEIIGDEDNIGLSKDKQQMVVKEGLRLFGEWFQALWL